MQVKRRQLLMKKSEKAPLVCYLSVKMVQDLDLSIMGTGEIRSVRV